jgi:hypothetical protein
MSSPDRTKIGVIGWWKGGKNHNYHFPGIYYIYVSDTYNPLTPR